VVFHTVLQYTNLKTVIVCALDATYIDALDENSNGCLNRSFGNIKRLPRLLFQCIPWPNRDGNPFGKSGEARVSAAKVRLIARTKVEFQQRKFRAEISGTNLLAGDRGQPRAPAFYLSRG
jgi:hypothetical protein